MNEKPENGEFEMSAKRQQACQTQGVKSCWGNVYSQLHVLGHTGVLKKQVVSGPHLSTRVLLLPVFLENMHYHSAGIETVSILYRFRDIASYLSKARV